MAFHVSSDKGPRVTPNMNVTPLVDIVLVLLIIFMVVTPLLTKQFWLNLPKKDDAAEAPPPPPAPPDQPVVLTVDAQGTIRINREVVERGALRDKLSRVFAARRDQVLFFDAKDDVPYGAAAEIMDIARTGGARTISILTEKTE